VGSAVWAVCHGRQDLRCTIDGIKTNGGTLRGYQPIVEIYKGCPGMIKACEVAEVIVTKRQRLSDSLNQSSGMSDTRRVEGGGCGRWS
jgi:hypothetical protein